MGICLTKPAVQVASFTLPININQPEIKKTRAVGVVFLGIIAKLVLFFVHGILTSVFND